MENLRLIGLIVGLALAYTLFARALGEALRRARTGQTRPADAPSALPRVLEHADPRCGGTWLLCIDAEGRRRALQCLSCEAAAAPTDDLIEAAKIENAIGRELERIAAEARASGGGRGG